MPEKCRKQFPKKIAFLNDFLRTRAILREILKMIVGEIISALHEQAFNLNSKRNCPRNFQTNSEELPERILKRSAKDFFFEENLEGSLFNLQSNLQNNYRRRSQSNNRRVLQKVRLRSFQIDDKIFKTKKKSKHVTSDLPKIFQMNLPQQFLK